MQVAWGVFKEFVDSRSLSIQYVDIGDSYELKAFDSIFMLSSSLPKDGGSDVTEFENTYKALGNGPISQNMVLTDGNNVKANQFDIDGAQIVRIKAAKKGWTFGAIPIEFRTSEIGSLYSKLVDGSDRAGITLKFYDSNGTEITDQGLLEINETGIVRTVVDFEPPYDYEVIGGTLRIGTDIAFDCRLWIIAVPDVSTNDGGSKEMAGGLNLKFLAPQQVFHVDGRVSKTLTYNATYHTNKLRFIFQHQAGTKTDIHINVELFRQ